MILPATPVQDIDITDACQKFCKDQLKVCQR
jgi:hypothetical protein